MADKVAGGRLSPSGSLGLSADQKGKSCVSTGGSDDSHVVVYLNESLRAESLYDRLPDCMIVYIVPV